MRILPWLVLALGVVVVGCTNSGNAVTTSTGPDTTVAPVTTLPRTETTTTTTAPDVTTTTVPRPTNDCTVGQDTSVEGYNQSCEVLGITIYAAEEVAPEAIEAMADRIFNMLVEAPDIVTAFRDAGITARVIGEDQRISNLPEFEEIFELYPGTDWNRRGRSFPGTDLIPVLAGAEENLLCQEETYYQGEDNFVRTLAIAIRRFGLQFVDQVTNAAIDRTYQTAIALDKWSNTLAEINSFEYWAEGTQSFFDTNLEEPEDRPANSSHNHVDTRDELAAYDPDLYALLNSVYTETDWRPGCP